ncbi:methyl-accepting chemotaxis protein [Pseudogracilibacillus sp. SE30717A]|uniref:methyl-accepting chemotaxis protein n=1 Tax=Pseudogracilibacillus sp. SE30717A TaxID=3098293 RepID=UPI00300E2CBB
MFFKRKIESWNKHTKKIMDSDIVIGENQTDRLKFLNITKDTLNDVREAGKYLLPFKEEMVHKFYENIMSSEHLVNIISKHSTVDRLKITQQQYIEQFLEADISNDYIQTRVQIGKVHSRINLTANHFIMAHDLLVQFMISILMEKLYKSPNKMMRLVIAIQKLATFDKQLITNVYTDATFQSFLHEISWMLQDITKLDTSEHLINGADTQIKETQSVTAATEQMSASIQEVSNHASEVAERTEEAVQAADNSRKVIDNSFYDIEQVDKTYEHVMENVVQLGKEIDHTHEVINVIKEIAEQTNLLALNASIEAARAGENGQGFAVVAAEVRKLSEHTKEQIEQITTNMESLQRVSTEVTERMKETGTRIEKSVVGSQAAGKELENIISVMHSINYQITEIAAMTEEQSSTVEEISDRNSTIFDLSKNVQHYAVETAEVIYEISKKMDNYRLSFLKTNVVENEKDIIQIAKTDHLLWKWNIYNRLLGFGDLQAEDVSSHTACRLGKWYYSDLPSKVKDKHAFKRLEKQHQAVHDYARLALEHYERDNIEESRSILTELEKASDAVVQCLEQIENDL